MPARPSPRPPQPASTPTPSCHHPAPGCWNASARVREAVLAAHGDLSDLSFRKLQVDWTRNVTAAAATAAGKVPIVWQSTPDGPADPAWAPSTARLPNETIFMAWLNDNAVAAYAQAGVQVVNTHGFYVAGMGNTGWQDVYSAAVVPSGLSGADAARVLGGQVCLWGEQLTEANLNMRAFQVGAGASENFWLGLNAPQGGTPPAGEGKLGLQDRYNRFLCHLRTLQVDAPPQMPSHCVDM